MAIVNSVAIGSGSGKLGEMGLSTNAGRTIARKYQDKVANPQSPAQVSQRNRMANVVLIYLYFATALTGAFKGRKKTESVYNAFVRHNVKFMHDEKKEDAAQALDGIEKIVIGDGSLGMITGERDNDDYTVDFSGIKHLLKPDDKLTVICAGVHSAIPLTQKLTAADIAAGTVTVDTAAVGNGVAAYITTANGQKSSNFEFVFVNE